ncbi:hypothetical protein LIT25_18430 [Bacillus sp. F19]|nr:hypothetical protein LIT25_18430 [Bacillus sp. F19]
MKPFQDVETNPFEMETNAPYSLNYLIFVQNIFRNNNKENNQKPSFPYLDSSQWGLLQEEDFIATFK